MAIQQVSKEEVKVVAGGLALRKLHTEIGTPHHLAVKSLAAGHVHEKTSLHHSKKSGS